MARFEVLIYPEVTHLYQAAAERITSALDQASKKQGQASVVLCGGNTPKPLFKLLASPPCSQSVLWERVHFFWGDERCVAPEHPESNYGMARKMLLDPLKIPSDHIHRIHGEMSDPAQASARYEAEILSAFGGVSAPEFDLVLLGLGNDGHTASLFPGSSWNCDRLVSAIFVATMNSYRISMTPKLLNAAKTIVFLVAGEEKTRAVEAVLGNASGDFPAKMINPTDGELIWLLDGAAAQGLSP